MGTTSTVYDGVYHFPRDNLGLYKTYRPVCCALTLPLTFA